MDDRATPLVSIITAHYNDSRYIHLALETVRNQTYDSIEHIIVDDGSDDQEFEKLLKLSSQWDFEIVRYDHNRGLSHARNVGIRKSNGKYILPLDVDDKLDTNWLSKTVDAAERLGANYSPLYTDVVMFGAVDVTLEKPTWSKGRMEAGPFIPATSLFSRYAYNMTGGYDESLPLWEDYDFWLSLMNKGFIGRKIEGIKFYYNMRVDSMSDHFNLRGGDSLKKEVARRIFLKHGIS